MSVPRPPEKVDVEAEISIIRTGVGTTVVKSMMTPITGWITKTVDMAVGFYLDHHVRSALSYMKYCKSGY